MIGIECKMAGRYRISVGKAEQAPRIETPWFDNLITDQGMDFIAAPPVFNTSFGWPYLNTHCAVGTGSTAPAFTDTQLVAQLAMYPNTAGTNVESSTVAYIAGPPAYWSCIWTYTFPAGSATGNIAEVGVGGMLNGDTIVRLFSRALIVDGAGNPTTISVLADEILTVTYELRLYIDTTDGTYSIVVNGITYGGTFRRAQVTTTPAMYLAIGTTNGLSTLFVYNGAIQSITQTPSGSISGGGNGSSTSVATYSPGTHYRDFTTSFDFTQGNLAGYISAIMLQSMHGCYQFQVSPVLPKDSTHQMNLTWRYTWTRYP